MSLTDEWRSSQSRPPDSYVFCWRAWSVSEVGPESSGLTCHNFLLRGQSQISSTQQTSSQIHHVWAPGAVRFSLTPCDFSQHSGNTVKSCRCVYELVRQFYNQLFTFSLFKVHSRANKFTTNIKRSRILEAILSAVLHKRKRGCCHTCSSRSASEKPATSTLLPLCPLTPGLTRLLLLHQADAAEKVKNKKPYLTDIVSQIRNCWMMKSVFCQASWLKTSVFHLSWQVYSDSTTDLFNDSDDLIFLYNWVFCKPSHVKHSASTHHFCQWWNDYSLHTHTLLPLHRPENATLFGKDHFFAHNSTFCQEQDRPPEGVYVTFSEHKPSVSRELKSS